MRPAVLSFCVLPLIPAAAMADVPQVAADIAPVHSLVSMVMEGVGTPDLIIPPGASPHGYALRPSEARALAGADLVVTVGSALTPWLEEPIGSLADGAARLVLMDAKGIAVMPFREGVGFAAHDHDHEGEEDHAHEGEEDHGHAEKEGHDHADDHAPHDDHDHADDRADHAHEDDSGDMDPHIWLDPVNGAAALAAIADALSDLDPENAETYAANAAAGQGQLDALRAELASALAPLAGRPFIVMHDSYHYFEARFGVEAMASISAGDAADPGAARVAELRATVADTPVFCAFAEPQMNVSLLKTVIEGQEARLGVLDPLGSALTPGPSLYPALLRDLGGALKDCLTP